MGANTAEQHAEWHSGCMVLPGTVLPTGHLLIVTKNLLCLTVIFLIQPQALPAHTDAGKVTRADQQQNPAESTGAHTHANNMTQPAAILVRRQEP